MDTRLNCTFFEERQKRKHIQKYNTIARSGNSRISFVSKSILVYLCVTPLMLTSCHAGKQRHPGKCHSLYHTSVEWLRRNTAFVIIVVAEFCAIEQLHSDISFRHSLEHSTEGGSFEADSGFEYASERSQSSNVVIEIEINFLTTWDCALVHYLANCRVRYVSDTFHTISRNGSCTLLVMAVSRSP